MASYDVIFLGGGPAGYVGAIRCGQLGLSTAVIEREGLVRPENEAAFLLQGIRTRRAAYAALAGCVADPLRGAHIPARFRFPRP